MSATWHDEAGEIIEAACAKTSATPRTDAFKLTCATYECLRLAKMEPNPHKATMGEIEFMMAIEIAGEHERELAAMTAERDALLKRIELLNGSPHGHCPECSIQDVNKHLKAERDAAVAAHVLCDRERQEARERVRELEKIMAERGL